MKKYWDAVGTGEYHLRKIKFQAWIRLIELYKLKDLLSSNQPRSFACYNEHPNHNHTVQATGVN